MGRKAHKPIPLNLGRIELLRYRFLNAVNKVCPEVVQGLKEVREKSSFDKWAEKFGIRGTWVEKAAETTLAVWRPYPVFQEESEWRLPVRAREYPYGHPDFPRMRQMMAVFHVTDYLFSVDARKAQFHAALEDDLKAMDTWAAAEGLTVPELIPGDLDKKMECAALYLYRGWTFDRPKARD